MLARIEFKLEEYLAYLDEVTPAKFRPPHPEADGSLIPWPIRKNPLVLTVTENAIKNGPVEMI